MDKRLIHGTLAAYVAAVLSLFVLAGCGKGLTAASAPPAPDKPGRAPVMDDQVTMDGRGLDLRLFDNNPTPGGPRKPTFWAHVKVFSQTGQDIWSFEDARAVIYGNSEGSEEIVLDAGKGSFQETKMAYLKDGVVAHVGDMKLDLSDIEWLNDERLARSDNPVAISGNDCSLKASSLRMFPDKKQLILTNVSGTLRMRRNEQ